MIKDAEWSLHLIEEISYLLSAIIDTNELEETAECIISILSNIEVVEMEIFVIWEIAHIIFEKLISSWIVTLENNLLKLYLFLREKKYLSEIS